MRAGKSMVAYSLSKSLVFRLAEIMNEEARGTDVVVSVVVPGTIDTPQNRESMPSADFNKWVTPAAIADVIFYYCSTEGRVLREPVLKVYGNG
jgi:NAD(P)-dependent dehydrogenase (short-subunit alcohol dehydrogenase family)